MIVDCALYRQGARVAVTCSATDIGSLRSQAVKGATLCSCTFALAQDTTPIETASFEVMHTYYAPNHAYKITIHSENGMVSVLEVPKGVLLEVHTQQKQDPKYTDSQELPIRFEGDLIISTRRSD